ncbi:MAG: hypothetical protein LC109_14105 [Bacteroidia bacterium]|nr:hypothetical protein [Bacteroidia bacterium]MCO5254595.1 hypothetical protein [Bacteroidota bacterium]MCZ2131384.1 hypothetical protein [Bacteroidia bacterium]
MEKVSRKERQEFLAKGAKRKLTQRRIESSYFSYISLFNHRRHREGTEGAKRKLTQRKNHPI